MLNKEEERLLSFIQKNMRGDCKILSVEECPCPLCDFDRIIRNKNFLQDEVNRLLSKLQQIMNLLSRIK